MKNLYIAIMLLLSTQLFSDELAWVNEQIEAIKPPRVGLNLKKLSTVTDPFIFLRKNKVKTRTYKRASTGKRGTPKKVIKRKPFKLVLNAILNKSAMINGKWYREGAKVYGYTLSKVQKNKILLVKKKKKILLSTKSKSINIKLNNK